MRCWLSLLPSTATLVTLLLSSSAATDITVVLLPSTAATNAIDPPALTAEHALLMLIDGRLVIRVWWVAYRPCCHANSREAGIFHGTGEEGLHGGMYFLFS